MPIIPVFFGHVRRFPFAFLGALYILLVCLVAIFAYPLATDTTPMANRMVVELGAKPAGFGMHYLKVPKRNAQAPKGFLARMLLGTPASYDLLPITSYRFAKDSITVAHYIDDGLVDTFRYTYAALGLAQADDTAVVASEVVVWQRSWLGTDRYGRDIYSRLLVGSRVSLAVGIVSVMLSMVLGISLGAAAGWYGGWVDGVVMYIINILWSIPTLLLVFAITISLGKGFWEIFVAIGLSSWVGAARLIRGQVMQAREQDYVTAARTLGFSTLRIIRRHILPNIAGPIMVIAAANFATAILVEAGLSFLGIGVQPPTPSWGLMIKEHYNFLIAGNPLLALLPGLAIMLLVLAFNLVGNALRDMLDVRT